MVCSRQLGQVTTRGFGNFNSGRPAGSLTRAEFASTRSSSIASSTAFDSASNFGSELTAGEAGFSLGFSSSALAAVEDSGWRDLFLRGSRSRRRPFVIELLLASDGAATEVFSLILREVSLESLDGTGNSADGLSC